MTSRDSTILGVIAALGILALLLLAAAGLFLFARGAPVAATGPAGSASSAPSDGYVARWKSATQASDGTWILVLTLTRQGTRTWNTLAVTAKVLDRHNQGGPWATDLTTAVPPDPVPSALDVTFRSGPIPRKAEELMVQLDIDSSYKSFTEGGSRSSSSSLPFPEPAAPAEREAGK